MTSSISLFVPRPLRRRNHGLVPRAIGNDEIYLGAVYVGISADKSFDVRVVWSVLGWRQLRRQGDFGLEPGAVHVRPRRSSRPPVPEGGARLARARRARLG